MRPSPAAIPRAPTAAPARRPAMASVPGQLPAHGAVRAAPMGNGNATPIDVLYFNAGGGHRAAALALQAVCDRQQRPWTLRLVNLFDVIDPQALFQRCTGMAPEDLYNLRLARGWTLGLAQELKLLQGGIRMAHNLLCERLSAHWRQSRPEMVVSLVPNFNRAMCQSLHALQPHTPFVTVMTDMADLPPHFWGEPDLPQHLVCGTPHALAQARAAGHGDDFLHATSGMLMHPDFHAPLEMDREAERAALGFAPGQPVGVVMFGGAGSMAMDAIARKLPDVPLILLCGHHTALAQRLRQHKAAAPRRVVGFTREVRRHLALGDFFIGKPGPGSLSEAVHMGLPVVTVRNAGTMPQERYNTQWLDDNGLGVVLNSFRDVGTAVPALCAQLPAFQAQVRRQHNRAIFEVPEILQRLLADAAGAQAMPRAA